MSMSASVYSLGVIACVAVAFQVNAWLQHRLRHGLPLPPGPPGLPFIGNTFNLNHVHPWLSYEEWGKRYGGIVYVKLLGRDFIIINSAKVAHDLLDLRSNIYSQRPYIPANETFGMDFNSGLLPYGSKWRLHRKMYNAGLNKTSARQYQSLAITKARQLVENILDDPEGFIEHSKTFAIAIIMAVIYGYDVAPKNDPFVSKIEHFMDLFMIALTPERAALFLAFPILAYVPSWFPGGGYKKRAAECRGVAEEVLTGPFEYVKENMASGTAGESLVRDLLETQDGQADEENIKAVAASAFLGGAETSDSTLRVFILAMVLHPEVQVKAWEEIDRVVGRDRLPDFNDRPHLPFLEAIYLETFRWRPVVPSALPHMTATSDEYEGMYIPKDAIVLLNIWAIVHDESQFDEPMEFKPERHLTSDGTVVERSGQPNFGCGRRICPGRHVADQNVWAAMATLLATVRISKARDESGKEIDLNVEFTSGIASAPKPFPCCISPRSPHAEELIRTREEIGH